MRKARPATSSGGDRDSARRLSRLPLEAPEHEDFYQGLRVRMRTWLAGHGAGYRYADYLMLAPDLFHLLCRLIGDPRVPASSKAKLLAGVAYFIAPTDVVPELLLGPAGYIDDVALSAYLLNELVQLTGEDILADHWAGDADVLAFIRSVLDEIDAVLSGGVWKAVRGMFGRRAR